MKKVSVIIPCYNSRQTIAKAIDSVLSQSYPIHEIICVDDCSKDGTAELISRDYKDVTVIVNYVNSGPSFSRNLGIKASTGDYIAFLDSDDFWLPEKTSIQMRFIERYGLSFIGSSVFIDGESVISHNNSFLIISKKKLLLKNYFPTPTVIMKKENYFFDEKMKYSEDYSLWLTISSDRKKMGFVSMPLVGLGKASYGASGLSSNLLKMESGELSAIYQSLNSNILLSMPYLLFSLLKFFKRVLNVFFIRKFFTKK